MYQGRIPISALFLVMFSSSVPQTHTHAWTMGPQIDIGKDRLGNHLVGADQVEGHSVGHVHQLEEHIEAKVVRMLSDVVLTNAMYPMHQHNR